MTAYLTIDGPTLAKMTGAGIRIAVIDSGVAASHPHVGAVGEGIALIGDDSTDIADRLGHGTAVFSAIREKAPGSELIPVRVLDRQLATSARVLAQAIDWAVAAGVHIVNLSFGTTNEAHRPLFEASLHAANERGVLVVSAFAQGETCWLPGSMHGAVGVIADASTPRMSIHVAHSAGVGRGAGETGGAIVAASPYPRPIDGVPVERNLSGVSFAVANATGLLARALEAGAPTESAEALMDWIERRAVPPTEGTS